MQEEKLLRSDYRWVEKLLYLQKTHKASLAELEAELEDMMPSASSSIVTFDHNTKNTHGDSQPEKWAIKRAESLRAKEIHSEIRKRKRHQKAISESMECLDDLESRLVFLKYHLEKSSRDCWLTLGLQKSRFYEIKNEIVGKVARYLGLV